MDCKINAVASLKNDLQTTASLDSLATSIAITGGSLTSTANINTGLLTAINLVDEVINTTASLINSGINAAPCPIIICIDGGSAFTTSYPGINGLLNGGSA